jgi:hypothetical protein
VEKQENVTSCNSCASIHLCSAAAIDNEQLGALVGADNLGCSVGTATIYNDDVADGERREFV